jgi:hypothetical protein
LPGSGGASAQPSRRRRTIVSTSGSSGMAGIIPAERQRTTPASLDGHQVAERGQLRRPDPGDQEQVIDRGKGAVRLAVGNDLLRQARPDPGQAIELGGRSRVQVDRDPGVSTPGVLTAGPFLPPAARDGTRT